MAERWHRLESELPAIQSALREQGLGGWLLYDLHARNAIAAALLGVGDLSRRYFVLIPASGDPHALVHKIEEAPWSEWPWLRSAYAGWRELDARLRELLAGAGRVAMEISPGDAVPALDLVPAGVVDLVEAAGTSIVSSAELVTLFHSRWTAEGLASHRRASAVVAETARAAFTRVAEALRAGESATEGWLREIVVDRLRAGGLAVGADAIVACGANAADPHYHPVGPGASLRAGTVLLLDLWGKEAPAAIYADQTWMAFLGSDVPERVSELWNAVRDARDAAVTFLREAWRDGRAVQGSEVDAAARSLLSGRGHGDAFIHRTGHSIDRDLHGTGPNIDDFETHETRRLIAGVGFSIEPGLYLPGEIGIRSEINVYMSDDGPQVTTPEPQVTLPALLR